MKILEWIKGVIGRMFRKDAQKVFGIKVEYSSIMENAIMQWQNILSGRPYWLDKENHIDTINFAKLITSDVAKKICLDIDINVDGSARADYLSEVVEELKKVLRDKVEDACGLGGIMFKPNGSSLKGDCISYIFPNDLLITDADANGNIRGAIFFDYDTDIKEEKYYTRMEYQRFEREQYLISNRVFCSKIKGQLGKEISFDDTPAWQNILPEAQIENVRDTLFAFYKPPYNNTFENASPLGVSVFSNAIKELRDLDVAWSRKSNEVEDSQHITFVNADQVAYTENQHVKLPRFIRTLDLGSGVGDEANIHEHVATLLTEQRIADINSILSMISTKCGFSQGAFVLDRKTGNITATQVEADDRETIETIKEMRDALKDTLDHLIYALNVYADLYDLAPAGEYEASYGFGDLTYNYEEDRARHWNYVIQGKYPLYRYYMKFEGMSEKEARTVVKEAKSENNPDDKDDMFGKE